MCLKELFNNDLLSTARQSTGDGSAVDSRGLEGKLTKREQYAVPC